jgi:hypothetical protein
MKKLPFLLLLFASCTNQIPEIRDSISLEGRWDFRIDSLDVGIEQKWFNQPLEGRANLPGSMAGNGLGNDVTLSTPWTGDILDSSYFKDDRYEKYRQPDNIKIPFWLKPVKYYTGPAWYQRELVIPERWEGQRITLFLERPHWESRVYINGMEAGTRNSLSTPHQYDITPLVNHGKNRISIRIDNRMIVPVGNNSHSVSDHTQTNWNGITGEICVQEHAPVCIRDIQVYPDIRSGSAKVVLTVSNLSGEPFEGTLELKAVSFNTEKSHTPPTLRRAISVPVMQQTIDLEYPMGKGTHYWSEFNPSLYRLEAALTGPHGETVDRQTAVFGMREFIAKGTRFEVNGRPVFLRGTLECCIFPLTGYPPTDEAPWVYLISRCREHGLNHIRFHSWCPPEAAFRAADKLGFYLQVECGSWANQGSSIGDGSPLDEWIYQEGDRILEAYGNHPSFCMMAYGNEPAGRNQEEYLGRLLDYWKSKDPRRVYTAAAGWPLIAENEYHNGPGPRIQHWEEGLGSVINATPPQTMFDFREVIAPYHIPFVSHEIGQWCVFPDFRETGKYTGVLKPTNFEIFKDLLEANHMGDQSGDFLMASGKLQALCYKAEIEAALRTPGLAGFQLLQLHDFPGQGTALVGILDPFFNSKGYITPEAFRRFCNQTVPLARLEKRVFVNTETFRAEIELAHFGEHPLTGQKVRFRIARKEGMRDVEERLLYEKTIEKEMIPIGSNIPLGTVEFDLKEIQGAARLTLQVSLEGTPYSNSWDFWVYPETVDLNPGAVFITDKLDRAALEKLEGGGALLLLTFGKVNGEYGAQVKIGFSTVFWNTAWTRGQAPHTLGILCDPAHPVFRHFPTQAHSNWQWWDPITHSQAMTLDHLPVEIRPLIQPIHTWFESRKLGLLFEAMCGGGKLMVCSIDLRNGLEKNLASRQLLQSILEYMNSADFHPETEVDPAQIRVMTVSSGPESI